MSMRVTKTPIPEFATEAEEVLFWQTHYSTDHVDWSLAKPVTFPNLIKMILADHLAHS